MGPPTEVGMPRQYQCSLHGRCTFITEITGVKCCGSCPDSTSKTLPPPKKDKPCVHLGEVTGATVVCPSCRGNVQLKLFACEVHSLCTVGKAAPGVACCNGTIIDGQLKPCEEKE